jgi:hypothetical protein
VILDEWLAANPLPPMTRLEALGAALRGLRAVRQVSQVELCARVNMEPGVSLSPARLGDAERGVPPGLRVAEVLTICTALSVDRVMAWNLVMGLDP